MGRKTKYSAQIVERILEAVRHSGSDRVAIEAAGISEATYYRWQQEFQEFRELVASSANVPRKLSRTIERKGNVGSTRLSIWTSARNMDF